MNRLVAICDTPEDARCIGRQLMGLFETQDVPSDRILDAEPPGQFSVISVDLNNQEKIRDLRQWLKQKPKTAKLIFVTQKGSRIESTQAYALGATDIIHRPMDITSVLAKPCGGFKTLAEGPPDFQSEASPGIVAALGALQDVFASAVTGTPPDQAVMDKAGEAVIQQIRSEGLETWIETVRKHHSQTYQHSLLVTGLAVGFGKHLGLSQPDLKRMSFAGMLHDIGKARIPLTVLEKPEALDKNEFEIIKKHPLLGSEILATVPDLPAQMIDAVVHHHEYLDGSGYPHGLGGNEISDLVRILTIADIFGALIERRAYKPPMSGAAAYQILLDMGPKLDKDLVREFHGISQVIMRVA